MLGEDKLKKLIFLFMLFSLTSCSLLGTTYNVGSKVGAVILDERELEDDWKDTQTNIQIRSDLTAEKASYGLDIEITVFEGEVMLNGALPTLSDIEKVVEIAWRPEHVTKVYNHIRIQKPSDILSTSEDAFLASSVRTRLILTQNITSVNYKITVDDKVLYIMGISKNQEEFNAVINTIYASQGIEQVISHVRKSYK